MDKSYFTTPHLTRYDYPCSPTIQQRLGGPPSSVISVPQNRYSLSQQTTRPHHIYSVQAHFAKAKQSVCLSCEPLDLSKPTPPAATSPQTLTHKTHSKLERMLSDNASSKHSRKRPYSSLSTETQEAWTTAAQPAAVGASVDQPPPSITAAVFNMDEAPDNPVVMAELAAGTQSTTREKFSCSLIRMMRKVFTIPQFSQLSEQDQVALLHNSWHRLMLWSLANDGFTFSVSAQNLQSANALTISPSLRRPTMSFVRGISVFIKKYSTLRITADEYSLLFGITLFHAGKQSQLTTPIERQRKELMRQLQELLLSTSTDPRRYTDLLLCLPLLYSVDESMFENLFCDKEFANGDVKLLLKDAVRQVTKKTGSD